MMDMLTELFSEIIDLHSEENCPASVVSILFFQLARFFWARWLNGQFVAADANNSN